MQLASGLFLGTVGSKNLCHMVILMPFEKVGHWLAMRKMRARLSMVWTGMVDDGHGCEDYVRCR